MYCPRCQNQTEDGAQFCRNCGISLQFVPENKQDNNVSSIMLLAYILILFFATIIQFIIEKTFTSLYETPWKYIMGILWIISSISFILPALAIKNMYLKIAGIVIASIWIIYHVTQNIEWMMMLSRY